MKIAIYGSGGVGGYFGARLAQAGEDVVFIARGAHLEAIQKNGLIVESGSGNFTIYPAQATDRPEQVGKVDFVLVGVKAWQVPEAALALRPMVHAQTRVIPLQNGVEAPDQLGKILGSDLVLGGLCQIATLIKAPGRIRHAGLEPYLAFGRMDNAIDEQAKILKQMFIQAGVKAEIPRDIQAAMWDKFLFIAAMGGVGAVTRSPAGVVRSIPETRHMLETAMQEIWEVAQARHVNLEKESISRRLAFIDGLVPGATTSMQRDIMEGRPSELEAQNGAVVRLGKEVGVSTPVHNFIYTSLLPQEHQARQNAGI